MSKTQELIELLKNLKTSKFAPHTEFLKTVCLVEDVLETLFNIEVTKTELNENERNIIGPLIASSLNAIGSWVSYSTEQIDEARLENYKIQRSGLQFILEKYHALPDGKGSRLRDALESFKATEDIEGWDQQLKNVSNSYDPNVSYKITNEPAVSIEESKQLPVSHWWWL